MGAWGPGPFDNDDAGDWVYELEGADDLSLARDTLVEAADSHSYLDADKGAVALAAAEVIAAAAGNPAAQLPEEVEAWLDTVRPAATPADAALARRAVEKVGGKQSELAELWDEAGRDPWDAASADVLRRLS